MSETRRTAPDPEILDYCDAPGDHECALWYENEAGEMTPCEKPADVLFVYHQSLDGSEDSRSNAFGCAEHAPVAVDGGDGQ